MSFIKMYRKSRRMSQCELSIKSKIGIYTLRKIESGKISPSVEQIHKLSKALRVSEIELFIEFMQDENTQEYSDELCIYF